MASLVGIADPTAGAIRTGSDETPKRKNLFTRFTALKTERSSYEDVWQDILDYVVPSRGTSLDIDTEEGMIGKQMFDGTAAFSCGVLADGFLSYLTSPQAPWFRLLPEGKPMLDESDYEVKAWLEYVESVMSYIFEKSNFYSAMNQVLLDGCSFGTALMLIDTDGMNIFFSTRHPKEFYISENEHGNIDTVFRNYKSSARAIVSRFPDSPAWLQKIAKDTPDKKYKIVHAVYPRADRDTSKADNVNKKFASEYILENTTELLEESGYGSFPYSTWRFKTNSGETYGRSPTWDALSDIKSSQAIMKTLLEKAHQSVEPPVMAPAEMRGRVSLKPRGVNWYVDPSRTISAINTGNGYPIGRDMQEKVQMAIKEHYRLDFFLSLNQQSAASRRTAFEASVLNAEKSAVLSSGVSRLERETLDPVFSRVFELAQQNGWIPDPPASMDRPVKVHYIGPLALTQKRHFNTQNVNAGLLEYSQFAQMWPEMIERVNADDLSVKMLEASGVPQSSIRSDKEIAQIREQQAQLQAQQMEQQQMTAEAEAYKNTAKAPEAGSGAEMIMGGEE